MRAKHSLLVALALSLTAAPAAAQGQVSIKVVKDVIEFRCGDELVTRYYTGPDAPRPYLWPMMAPGCKESLTRAWPIDKSGPAGTTDHVHHRSAWFCHGDVIPEGVPLKQKIKGVQGVDFWSEAKGYGRIVCTAAEAPKVDKDRGRVATRNEWRTADGAKVLDEARSVGLYDFGKARLLVLEIDLHASVCPVEFGDTKEGSMGVRVNDKIVADQGKKGKGAPGKIENAEGKVGEKECWGQLSKWCDYSGILDGKTYGITMFDDPKNPSPACWHVRGYGLLAANPFGRTKSFPAMKGKTDVVRLARGEHLRLRYGILLHPGDAREGQVASYYERYLKLRDTGG